MIDGLIGRWIDRSMDRWIHGFAAFDRISLTPEPDRLALASHVVLLPWSVGPVISQSLRDRVYDVDSDSASSHCLLKNSMYSKQITSSLAMPCQGFADTGRIRTKATKATKVVARHQVSTATKVVATARHLVSKATVATARHLVSKSTKVVATARHLVRKAIKATSQSN